MNFDRSAEIVVSRKNLRGGINRPGGDRGRSKMRTSAASKAFISSSISRIGGGFLGMNCESEIDFKSSFHGFCSEVISPEFPVTQCVKIDANSTDCQ